MGRVVVMCMAMLSLLLGGLACEDDAIVDAGANSRPLFPVEIGTDFRYEILDSINEIQDTIRVAIVGQRTLPTGDVSRIWRIEYDEDPDSIDIVVRGDTVEMYLGLYSDPTVLVVPMELGDGWSVAPSGVDWSDTCAVVDTSLWALQIGSFRKVFHVERSWEGPGYNEHNDIYFSPQVGLMMMDIEGASVIEEVDPVDLRWLLIDYNLPD